MKKMDIGQAILIIENVGVIAGIVLLTLERPRNNFSGAKRVPLSARRLSRAESPAMGTAVLSTCFR